MEAEYGVRLFERKGRGLQVTQAGMHLYARACELLSLACEVDSQMHAWAKGLKGKSSGLMSVFNGAIFLRTPKPR